MATLATGCSAATPSEVEPSSTSAPFVSGSTGESEAELSTSVTSAGAIDLQDAILEDGVVTDAEMDSAMSATIECIERLGFSASAGGADGRDLVTSADRAQEEELLEATDSCSLEYKDRAELRYAWGHPPEDWDLEALWSCLEKGGLIDDSSSDPTVAFQLAAAQNQEGTSRCFNQIRNG